MNKRVVSKILLVAMMLLLAVPAFGSTNTGTTITGNYQAVPLKVTVPTTGTAVINPYGLPIKLGDYNISGEQITTGVALTIINKSTVALDVGAEVTVTIPSTADEIIFNGGLSAASAGDGTVTDKEFSLQLEVFEDTALKGDPDSAVKNAKFATLKSADADMTVKPTATAGNGGAATAGATQAADGSVVLKEGDANGNLQEGGAAYFRLSGNVVKKPTTAWDASKDGFSVTIAWTFEPGKYPVAHSVYPTLAGGATAGSIDNDNTNVTPGTTTKDITVALPTGVTSVSNVKWKSSNPSVAAVSDLSNSTSIKGGIYYVADGEADITVTFTGNDGNVYRSLPFHVTSAHT